MIAITLTTTDSGWRLSLTQNGVHKKSFFTDNWIKLQLTAERWKEQVYYLQQLN